MRIIAALLLAAAGAVVGAQTPDATLHDCRAIAEATARLACYDAIELRAPPSPEKDFGKPPAPATAAEPASIRSRLQGPFDGWKAGTRFRLENGQVWKATGDDEGYYPGIPDNPVVTITRNFFGAYWMSVEGVGRRIKVKRIS